MTEGDLYIDVQYNLLTGVYLRELADEIFDFLFLKKKNFFPG